MHEELTVLNDVVKVGDRVAVAITTGGHGSGMRTGTILEIQGTGRFAKVKLSVEQTSGVHFGGPMPYIQTFDNPMRMVKLGSVINEER